MTDILELATGGRGIARGAALDRLNHGTVREVRHGQVAIRFLCPNAITTARARTFSTKEPETLAWIDDFQPGSVLWDIGANVGLYSIYAALRVTDGKVVAFEPSVMNLDVLARNVSLNGVSDRVAIVPLALSDHTGLATMTLSTLEIGGAHSAFGVEWGYDGSPLARSGGLAYQMAGITGGDALKLGVSFPDHIKLDVDGIEHLILAGLEPILADRRLKSILVEESASFAEQQKTCVRLLEAHQFKIMRRGVEQEPGSANVIWSR